MGVLSNLFHRESGIVISTPVKGEAIPLAQVKDATFSQEILGKGVGIIPMEDEIRIPADGVVSMIFPTGHAFTMKTEEGAELLVHIGIDTVQLNGQYFEKLVKEGETVKKGTAVIRSDMHAIKTEGYDTTVMLVVCNTDDYKSVDVLRAGEVNVGEHILRLVKN